ncbi:MAG: exodeoxyribonuclease VII small subunit [Gemmatimonadales bacterium]|nr:exodeoxyribonuclease VII small subunit [Gemmatimonadales bacterium]MYG48073.1 exodeoxyribonuclease VII small subunit [Gemmatimonadales bacterium]MYK01827.1 exodeoxyribonuclease VII small subunit [Candidatus Palauibacter ramosifaciens]
MSEPSKEFEFETAIRELEGIVAGLDREGIGLDEAIALFEQGIERLGEARNWLETASGRVEELIASSTGELEARPLEGVEAPDGKPEDRSEREP